MMPLCFINGLSNEWDAMDGSGIIEDGPIVEVSGEFPLACLTVRFQFSPAPVSGLLQQGKFPDLPRH